MLSDYSDLNLAAALGLLFASSFIASTLIPMSSEAVLAGLIAAGFTPAWLFPVAIFGNTLGAVVNWLLGYTGIDLLKRRMSPFSQKQLERAQKAFNRFGLVSLLFSWLPIIGDPLTFVAGILKIRFKVFLPLVAIGKAARYFVVIALTRYFW
jgi:membrane protein YqaA with SNARE-associated domain